jgi:hypothetical protein
MPGSFDGETGAVAACESAVFQEFGGLADSFMSRMPACPLVGRERDRDRDRANARVGGDNDRFRWFAVEAVLPSFANQ